MVKHISFYRFLILVIGLSLSHEVVADPNVYPYIPPITPGVARELPDNRPRFDDYGTDTIMVLAPSNAEVWAGTIFEFWDGPDGRQGGSSSVPDFSHPHKVSQQQPGKVWKITKAADGKDIVVRVRFNQDGRIVDQCIRIYSPCQLNFLNYGSEAPSIPADKALVEVRVPNDADVWFEDSTTGQLGTLRTFTSPPLESGRKYSYEIRARWNEEGRIFDQTWKTLVQAGKKTLVNFFEKKSNVNPLLVTDEQNVASSLPECSGARWNSYEDSIGAEELRGRIEHIKRFGY